MLQNLKLQTDPSIVSDELRLKTIISTLLNVDINRIKKIDLLKRSIDARQKKIKINVTLNVHLDEIDEASLKSNLSKIEFPYLGENVPEAIIVGAGPAGLFAALQLIEDGVRPIILERGKDVDSRRKDLAAISREQKINPESNYCFGEGGAGAFSDGKLYTRSKKKGSVEKILKIFYSHGAPESILIDSHPHIGTDLLPGVIKKIRETIISHGGKIYFESRVDDIVVESDEVKGVIISNGTFYKGPVILAIGHSARDTYRMLNDKNIDMVPKGIAVGVRLEHPQQLIDQLQYHNKNGRGKYLPAAEYSLLTRIKDRAVYSFCMCPGGVIVPSASGFGQLAVNGMSPSNRGSKWANSGMVVEILPDDISDENPLKILDFQERIEKIFFDDAKGTQRAPAQRMDDFVKGKDSDSLPQSSYAPGIYASRVDKLLPEFISDRLKKGFLEFDRKQKGFLTPKATVIGAETRTSSPVQIPRQQDTFEHIKISGLYPVGEGAGWAGGIVSAAIDGQKAAKSLAKKINNIK